MSSRNAFLRTVSAVKDLRWKAGKVITHGRQSARPSNAPSPINSDTTATMIPPIAHEFPHHEPLSPRPARGIDNPVLTAADVFGYGTAEFVADPFVFVQSDTWHLFFEIFNGHRDPPAVIGHARSRDAGATWSFTDVVLRTDTHIAFPYVFEWEGSHYMIPDRWDHVNWEPRDIKLYRASHFPESWTECATLVSPTHRLNDVVTFRFDDRWWSIGGDGRNLYAYYSDELVADGWTPHPENPVVSDRPTGGRPGGRPIVGHDRILLYLQDCTAGYGSKLRAFEVTRLTPESYEDHEHPQSPVLEPDERLIGWNAGKMHHLDSVYVDGQWRCVVDGNIGLQRIFGNHHWSIGLFEA
ncbi:glucosamine inositolphosphorylceramide transferase family protein [Natrinema amylolyticum]|uniref:glucosamine inositolphosphorylceramide transferase family protein n=1 Tax=Natrinema amylolyticum TaxID=2878679 RepID=UPI001CF9A817|nr:hypothetical protein [Natrinema amylolyticum]